MEACDQPTFLNTKEGTRVLLFEFVYFCKGLHFFVLCSQMFDMRQCNLVQICH